MWIEKIQEAERYFEPWRKNGQTITDRFRGKNDSMESDQVDYNLHHANAQLYISMVYPKTPKPVTRRKWTKNPAGIQLADVLQSAVQATVDQYDFDEQIESAMIDYYNAAMGMVRCHYVPYYGDVGKERVPVRAQDELDGSTTLVTEDGKKVDPEDVKEDQEGLYIDGKDQREILHEEIQFEFVPWNRFGYDPDALCWDGVEWTYIKHSLSENEVITKFGKKAVKKMNWGTGRANSEGEYVGRRADVYEVFDKVKRQQVFCSESYSVDDGVILVNDDPWGLEGFYPHPAPLMGVVTSDKMIPVPQYQILEPLYQELDEVQARIFNVASAIKIRGGYDPQWSDQFDQILNGDDGAYVPIESWSMFAERPGGADSAVWHWPINDFVAALNTLAGHRNQVRQQIDELTPFFDAARGGGRVDESAAMTKTKTRYSDARINREIKKVNKFVRNLYRVAGEMIAELFSAQTLTNITGKPVDEPQMALLRDEFARSLLVDIEIDQDAFEEDRTKRQELAEFMGAMNSAAGAAMTLQQMGFSSEYARSVFKKAIEAYPDFRDLEESFANEPNALAPPPPPEQPPSAQGGGDGGGGGQPPPGPPA